MRVGNMRMFCDVALTGSFTDTARLHGCTAACVSQSFHALEREFGLPLAVPGLRRIHLNPAGLVCHEYCRHIVGLEDELVDILHKIRAGSGSLEVAACPCIGLYRLPPLLHAFQQAFPGITVRVRQESHDGVHQAVLNNDVDAGLVPYPRRSPGLVVGIFRRVPLVLACHPANPLAAQPVVTVRQLKNRPVVVWNLVPWLPLLSGVRANERHFFEPRHEFDDVESAIEAVMAGLGVAVLPASLVRDEVAQRRLAAVPFEHGRHTVPVAAIHRRRRKLPPALQQFLQFLQQPEPDSSPVGTADVVRRTGEG
jgi:DNA-binding transcriptional LysR family regulator